MKRNYVAKISIWLAGIFIFSIGTVIPNQNDKALASHLRGGLVTAEYHPASGSHAEEVHITSTMLATTQSPDNFTSLTVYRVDGASQINISSYCTITYTSTTDAQSNPNFSINETQFTVTDKANTSPDCFSVSGDYIFESSTCCRISGIENAQSSIQFESRLKIDKVNESTAPTYSAGYMYNIAYSANLNYSTNLNGLGQGNTPVTYELITNTASSLGAYGATQIPCSNLNTSTGIFRINSTFCQGSDTIQSKFGNSQLYGLKVKATDSNGQYSTRDVLLQFSNTSNNAPVFSATSPAPGSLSVTPGTSSTITVSATDADSNTVDFTENLSRAWITESSVTTTGSGASRVFSKTYTIAPPAGTNETLQFEISAFDNATFSLSTSIQYDIEAGGVLPPGTPGTPTLVAGPSSLTASFSAPTSGGSVSSYRADVTPTPSGTTVQFTCSAPPATCSLSGLSPLTEYSVVIVAINTSGSATSAAATETTLAGAVSSGGGTGGGASTAVPSTTPTTTPTPTRSTSPVVRNTPILSGPVNTGTNLNQISNRPQTLIGGVPTNTTTRIVDQSKLNVLAGALNLEIQVPQNVGSVTNNGGSTQLQVQKGGVTTINGSGLRPLSTVQVFLPLGGNNSRELARIPVTSSGTFNGLATFANPTQGAPLPIGPQVLQIVSVDSAGRQAVVEMKVSIAQPAPAPEQNRANGQLPELTPGQSIATEAGLPVPVTVEAIEQQRQAIIQGDTWNMSINVPNANGEVTKTEGGALLKFVQNESVFVEGDGFLPGTRADVWLFSDPTLLGTVEIDENGKFAGQIAVDGKFVPTGEHTLQVQGVGDDGYVRSANLGVVVEANTISANSLLNSTWFYALLGVGLAAITTFFALARRRRKEAKHT